MMEDLIRVDGLVKVYPGGYKALDGVSFSGKKGKVLGLLGPNGAGKTTTIRIITTYLYPNAGRVWVNGIDALRYPLLARKLFGYMPENLVFYPELTVWEFLLFRVRLKGVPFSQEKKEVWRVMELAYIEDAKDKLISSLSKGYRQRLGFADALINNPALLILDEPTIGLDPNQVVKFRSRLLELKEETAIIFSSHLLSEVETVCDEVVIIDRGKVIAYGDKEDLLSRRGAWVSLEVRGQRVSEFIEWLEGNVADFDREDQEDGWVKVRVKENLDNTMMVSIHKKVCELGLDLRRLASERSSLEELFLSLTEKEVGR